MTPPWFGENAGVGLGNVEPWSAGGNDDDLDRETIFVFFINRWLLWGSWAV